MCCLKQELNGKLVNNYTLRRRRVEYDCARDTSEGHRPFKVVQVIKQSVLLQ